jgi:FAD/FMN-containing dehydrogenase
VSVSWSRRAGPIPACRGALPLFGGISLKRSPYLPLVMDAALIDLQQRIKRTFDPLNILNPGKIFPSP